MIFKKMGISLMFIEMHVDKILKILIDLNVQIEEM